MLRQKLKIFSLVRQMMKVINFYRSVIEGQVKVNLELLEQIRDEAEKDLNDPLLIPAVTELLNQVQKMEAENI